jgi:hypothetical protein
MQNASKPITARFYFIGAITLALVLGGCASREPGLEPPRELLKHNLATTDGGTAPDAGLTPSTAATGSAITESASQGPLSLIPPQTPLSTTGVVQNQQMLDRPQDQPSSIEADTGSTGPGDGPDGDTITAVGSQQDSNENGNDGQSSFGQLSYPAAMEGEVAKTK